MCSFAHPLKASTIASFDTNDFGHAKGTDIVIKSEGDFDVFQCQSIPKDLTCHGRNKFQTKKFHQDFLVVLCTVCIVLEHPTQFSQILQTLEQEHLLRG
jgi:hypothetical protein